MQTNQRIWKLTFTIAAITSCCQCPQAPAVEVNNLAFREPNSYRNNVNNNLRPARLRARLMTADGQPLIQGRASLDHRAGEQLWSSYKPDSSGEVYIENIMPGPRVLSVTDHAGITKSVDIILLPGAASSITVKMPMDARLLAEVPPVPGARYYNVSGVRCADEDDLPHESWYEGELRGKTADAKVTPGRYYLFVEAIDRNGRQIARFNSAIVKLSPGAVTKVPLKRMRTL